LSNRNTARALVGSILAIVGNTIPTMFWILGHIYSDASLLTAIRQELEATLPQDIMSQPSKVEVDVAAIREKCPLFMSSYEEVLRMTAGIATVRYTMSDTMINNRWLLKKDATIQMPTAFIHADPNTWGSDANIFNPKRFVNTKSLPQDQRSKRNTAFRPFGGGNTLCPGRYFAFHEIISFVATIMLGFEMKPAGGVWRLPEKDKSKLPITSLKPRTDIELMIQRRKGWESLMFE
jgi:cytochrome P450